MKGNKRKKETEVKMLLSISPELHERLKQVQSEARNKIGAIIPLTKIISNYLERNKDNIKIEF